jgi:hypothetical protein
VASSPTRSPAPGGAARRARLTLNRTLICKKHTPDLRPQSTLPARKCPPPLLRRHQCVKLTSPTTDPTQQLARKHPSSAQPQTLSGDSGKPPPGLYPEFRAVFT